MSAEKCDSELGTAAALVAVCQIATNALEVHRNISGLLVVLSGVKGLYLLPTLNFIYYVYTGAEQG